jgi:Fe-S cluster biosynthesis and repair protein YggX
MKTFLVVCITVFCMAWFAQADDGPLDFSPIVNEVSIFQNSSDEGDNLGQTLQIIFINEIKLGTAFNLEFTADFNRRMTPGENEDYYLEISLVKPVWKKLSVNYQRIHGTFMADPANQFGVRWSF